jgi:hypothetical protein
MMNRLRERRFTARGADLMGLSNPAVHASTSTYRFSVQTFVRIISIKMPARAVPPVCRTRSAVGRKKSLQDLRRSAFGSLFLRERVRVRGIKNKELPFLSPHPDLLPEGEGAKCVSPAL